MNKQNPYLAQYYARLGVPLNKPAEGINSLKNALGNYNYHLKNRKNIAAQRKTLR